MAHIDEIYGAADAGLSELSLLSERAPLVSVSPSMLTLLAFRAMRDAGVAGAGVLGDQHGELLANLSISDLRCALRHALQWSTWCNVGDQVR